MVTVSIQQTCVRLLNGGSLPDKLHVFDVDALVDGPPLPGTPRPQPQRDAGLRIATGVDRLPSLKDVAQPDARRSCLHRFANHELQAIEMMAWAILAFPEMPESFRRGLLRSIAEEQAHLGLYLDRLATLGGSFGAEPLSGNFWAQAQGLHTPKAFLCAMGLTFENANLDFTLLYGDAFRRVGATAEAAVMDRIHHDERGHVAWALSWVRRLKEPTQTDLEAYLANTTFPLGLHRAKGRNCDVGARRAVGFDAAFIQALKAARSPQEQFPRSGVTLPETPSR